MIRSILQTGHLYVTLTNNNPYLREMIPADDNLSSKRVLDRDHPLRLEVWALDRGLRVF
jgi:hypothetical protein